MKKTLTALSIFCLATCIGGAAAETAKNGVKAPTSFTTELVSTKSMISSGFPKGYFTFNVDGTLTCTGYPAFVTCRTWKIEPDGTLLRQFASVAIKVDSM